MFDREYERYESFMMFASYGKNPMDIHFFDEDDKPRRQSFLDAIDEEMDDLDIEDDFDDEDDFDGEEDFDDEDDWDDDVDVDYRW